MIKITSKNETSAQLIATQNIISQISDSLKFRPDGYMFNPYFYIIEHIPSGKYYAGVRFAKNCNKDELLQEDGYQTSSKVVKDIIDKEGLESFRIRKIKEFNNKFDAMEYETRFLQKVDAMNNDKFLNLNNTAAINYNTKKLCEYYNVEYVSQIPYIKEKVKETNLERYGYKYSSQNPEIKKKMIEKQFGKNNINFKGYYITPDGKFESVSHINMADKKLLLTKNMIKWCKNPNRIISIISYKKSAYLKKNFKQEDIVGIKTFKDIGFDFEAVEK